VASTADAYLRYLQSSDSGVRLPEVPVRVRVRSPSPSPSPSPKPESACPTPDSGGLATNFARGRHSTGYRAFSPADLSFQPADSDPRCSFPRPIPIFPCYICRSPVDCTGFQAGSGPARCLRHRPNLNFHRLGPEPLPVRGKHCWRLKEIPGECSPAAFSDREQLPTRYSTPQLASPGRKKPPLGDRL
jgi:hypothetical protein